MTPDEAIETLRGMVIHVNGDWRRLLDPVTNVRVAYRIYVRAGRSPWHGGRWSC